MSRDEYRVKALKDGFEVHVSNEKRGYILLWDRDGDSGMSISSPFAGGVVEDRMLSMGVAIEWAKGVLAEVDFNNFDVAHFAAKEMEEPKVWVHIPGKLVPKSNRRS